ncbi:hypothetical protein JCM10296v2_003457 [Rhodotorula toruloides]
MRPRSPRPRQRSLVTSAFSLAAIVASLASLASASAAPLLDARNATVLDFAQNSTLSPSSAQTSASSATLPLIGLNATVNFDGSIGAGAGFAVETGVLRPAKTGGLAGLPTTPANATVARSATTGRLQAVQTASKNSTISSSANAGKHRPTLIASTSAANSSLPSSTLSSANSTVTTTATLTSLAHNSTRTLVPSRNSTISRSSSANSTSSSTKPTSTASRKSTSAATSSPSTSHRKSTTAKPAATSRTTSAHRAPSAHTHKPSPTSTRSTASDASPTRPSKPQATRYGNAPAKGCKKPPSTFAGTSAGFASLCQVRYCDAQPTRNMAWSGFDGDVTRTEIETALGMLKQLEPLWANGQDNVLSTGYLGQAAHDAGLLYEVTGDIRALDVSIQVADNILALQNANTPGGGVTIWTGAKDSVWPPGNLNPPEGQLVYAGCEQGLIVGNMVQAANYILKSPCLWNKVPPVFQGPTVFDESATYYDRALAYIKAADDTYDSFFFRFLDSNLSIIQPDDPRWDLTGDSRKSGTPMPWNRRMLALHGYIQLAIAHETPAAFDAKKTALYGTIVKRNVMDFLMALNEQKSVVNGKMTFNWDYSAGEEGHTEESQGIHCYYDILGSWSAWQRNSAVFGLSNYIGYTFANTFENTISFGNGSFAGLVTGDSSKKAYTVNQLYAGWSFYALWLPEWFKTVAQANVASGFRGRTWLAIPLLWTKHALAVNDMTFWSGLFSSGFGVVVGTESTTAHGSSTSGVHSASPCLAATPTTAALAFLVVLAATILLQAT